ncbi:MAG TPA: hypothetical protein VIM12_13825 [Noviherbaspirillum sp.]|uniref:hypothetical protein n=1 Tax=Noviherbaspirillum sp. TaxID=1926288 RepID=UPI002F920C3F
MGTDTGQTLQSVDQSALADEIVAALVAVVADASAPESAIGGLRNSRETSLSREQRAAAAALQAYGVECATGVLAAGLETDAQERAARLGAALQEDSAEDALALLRSDPDAGAEFKSRLSLDIAAKCAEMIAADIDRDKTGHFDILDKEDAAVFEARREEHRKQRNAAARDFLASLPARYPGFGAALFADIRHAVQRQVEEEHKRPDTHRAVASMFDEALAAMPDAQRDAVARARPKGS